MLLSLKAGPVWRGPRRTPTGLATTVLLLAGVAPGPLESAEPLFSKDVLPILEQKCFQCHGDGQTVSDLDLSSRAGMLKGGVHGPALGPVGFTYFYQGLDQRLTGNRGRVLEKALA